MTISNTNRRAGPFLGAGSPGPFAFDFYMPSPEYVVAVLADSDGIETNLVYGADFSVVLNEDQSENPGGDLTLANALAIGYSLTLTSNVPPLQTTDITNLSGFYQKLITVSLDRLTVLVQQLGERTGRALALGVSDTTGSGAYRAGGNRIQDVGDPVALGDAVNKQYVVAAIANLAADGSGQAVVERLADTSNDQNGAAMVGADDGASGSAFTTVQGFITRLLSSASGGSGAAVVGADDGASGSAFTTVQGFIVKVQDFMENLLSYVNFKWSTLTDSDPSVSTSALKLRAVTAGRRGEIQIVPNDGDGTNVAGQRDQDAGGEVTIMGYDVDGALGFSNNIATTLRYMRTAGVCQSVDLMTFRAGSQTDVPIRFGNDAKGYTVQISEVTGKLISSFGVRAGDGIGDFPQANPLPAFAASGDQPAYDFEERPTVGGAIINQWRIRLINGSLDIQNLTDSKVQFKITSDGHVQMPNLATANTDSGANTPNAIIDPSTGELKRATYTKLNISGAATDAASTQTLVNQLRTVIINYGLAQ